MKAAAPRFYSASPWKTHQPFDAEKFGYACQIGVESKTLSQENMAIVRVMLEGITRADQALGDLVEQLRSSDQPTLVVFFGDHRPNLFMTDGDTVYTKLGLCPDNDTAGWTAEQIGDLYSTDYLIWANDAALLQGRAGTRQESSVTAPGASAAGADRRGLDPLVGAAGPHQPLFPDRHGSLFCGRNGKGIFFRGRGAPQRRGAGADRAEAGGHL